MVLEGTQNQSLIKELSGLYASVTLSKKSETYASIRHKT